MSTVAGGGSTVPRPAWDKRDGLWHAIDPVQGTDERVRGVFTEIATGVTRYRVRCWRGVIARYDESVERERDRWLRDACPHAHNKKGAAVRCAEAAAKRLNRQLKDGGKE